MPSERDCRLALEALAALVDQEYPQGWTLAKIADVHGNEPMRAEGLVTSEHVEALERVEAALGLQKMRLRGSDDALKAVDVPLH